MIVEDLIEVEKIISHRLKDEKIEYEIKLCGYDKLEWVKIDFFELEQKNLIEDYHKKHQLDSNGQIIINVKSKNEKINITKKIKTVTSNKPKKIPIIKKEIMISEKETILLKKECSTKATLPISTRRSETVETIESSKSSSITTLSSKSTVDKVLSSQLIVNKDNINKTNKECSRKRGHSVQKSQLGNEINQCKETNDKTTQESIVKKDTIPVCTIKPIFKQNDLSSPIKRIKLTKSIQINNEVAAVKKIWLFANTPPTIDNLTVIIVQNESQEFDKIVKSHYRDIVAQMVKENPDLLVKAAANNNVKICNSLLCLGANINEGDSSGTTALVAAFNKEYETIIDLLIKKGVDINIDFNGRNEMLEKCITNNNVNMFKLLLTANPDYSQIEHLITDKTSSIATVLEDHKKKILEYLDIKIRSFNYQFYKDIMDLMYSNNDVKIIYLDQTTIPPNLKTNRLSRKMVLFSCVTPKSYTIDQIIEGPLEGAFDIHVANNEGQLVANYEGKRLVTMLQTNKTYYINEEDAAAWKFSLRPNKDPEQCAFICALELFTKKVTKSLNEKSTDYGYTYNPSEDDFRQRLSFIRKPLSLQEIRSRLIFIDVHLRKTMSRRWTPVQLAILNYGGDVLLNTLICPRERLLISSDWGYNITDEDVRGQLDEEEAKKLTRKITENKILVGHNLNSVIENLDINKEALCGLRDLSNAPVIRKLTLDNHRFIGLKNITKKLSIEGPLWYPKLKASTILTIYKAVESKWEDDVIINKENIKDCSKKEISSSHSRNENIFTAFSNIKDIQGTKNEDLSNNKMNIKENCANNEKVNKIETIIRAKEKEVAAEECKDTLLSDGRGIISAVNNKLNEEREAEDMDQRNESSVIIKDNEGIKERDAEELHNKDKNKAILTSNYKRSSLSSSDDIKIMNKEELNIKNKELCVVGAPSFNENMIKHVSPKKIYIKVDENRSVNNNNVQATINITKCDDKITNESSDKSKDYVSKKVHDLNSKMIIKHKDSSSANDHNITLKSNECIKENDDRTNRTLRSQNMKLCIKNIEPEKKKESNTCDENGVIQNKSTNKHRSTSRINSRSRRSSTHMTHTRRSRSRNRTGSKINRSISKSHKRNRSRSKSRKKDRYRSKSRKRDRSISKSCEKKRSRNRSISVNNKSSRVIETKNVSSTDRIYIKCNGEKERGKDDHALRNNHNNKCKSVSDFKDCVVASKRDNKLRSKDECNNSSTRKHNKTFIAANHEKDAKELHNKDINKTISLSLRDDINYRHKKNCAVLNDKSKTEIHRRHDDQTISSDHHFKINETKVAGKIFVSLDRNESLPKLNDEINNKNKKDSSAILTNKNILVKDNKVLDNDHGRCTNDRNDRQNNIFTRMKEMQVKGERKLPSHNNNNDDEDRTLKMGIFSLNSPEKSFCVTNEHTTLCSLKDNITFNTI